MMTMMMIAQRLHALFSGGQVLPVADTGATSQATINGSRGMLT